jgi:tRNA/tmRNA/rRNA uracil-C5-methylase (TrmA/RlmC/RlmD family)
MNGMEHDACPHLPPCPGCPRFGAPGLANETRTKLDSLAQAHGLPSPTVVEGPSFGFRSRARLAIRGEPGSPRIGMFRQGTHEVVEIPHCAVHHPLVNHVAVTVRRTLADVGAPPYVESLHRGLARYLQVVVERSSETAQVVLVVNSPDSAPIAQCLDLLRDRLAGRLHSLWFNSQCARTNTILGPTFQKWCGPDSLVERFGGAEVHYPPGAFGQGNLEIAARIIDFLRARVPHGSSVAEFRAGVGAIGLSVVPQVASLRLNEIGPQSLQGLALGLAALDPELRARVSVWPGPAGEQAGMADGADVVIVDPPRKGLEPALLERLASTSPPQRLLYVSCSLESLLRDAARLTGSGALRLAELRAFNLMPYTSHVETVACFERA